MRNANGDTRVFISHRRDQAASDAKAIAESLKKRKIPGVFIDAQMTGGTDFHAELDDHLDVTDVLIAVIHPGWATGDSDAHRLQDPNDWVRIEIATALQRRIAVVPVLVRKAELPPADAVPSELRGLADTNPFRLPHPPEPYWAQLQKRIADELRGAETARASSADTAVLMATAGDSLAWTGHLRGDQRTVYRAIAARLARAFAMDRIRRRLLGLEFEEFVLLHRSWDSVEKLNVALDTEEAVNRTRVIASAPSGMARQFERVVYAIFATRRVEGGSPKRLLTGHE